MKKLAEELAGFIGESAQSSERKAADDLLKKGIMPSGEKWATGKPKLFFKPGSSDLIVKKEKRTRKKDGSVSYTGDVTFKPGKGGGSGISFDHTASNHFFNLVGTTKAALDGMRAAMSAQAKRDSRRLNNEILQWFKKNFLWRVVGFDKRNQYKIDKVEFMRVDYKTPMIDPTRRKWPSGRTEVWMPVEARVMVKASPKGK